MQAFDYGCCLPTGHYNNFVVDQLLDVVESDVRQGFLEDHMKGKGQRLVRR